MGLSERMGMSLKRFYNEFDIAEISERMAYDLLKDKDYRDNIKMQSMTDEESSQAIMQLLGKK